MHITEDFCRYKCSRFVVGSYAERTAPAMMAKKPARNIQEEKEGVEEADVDGDGEAGDGETGVQEVAGHDTSLPAVHKLPPEFHVFSEQVTMVKLSHAQASQFCGSPLARFKLLMVGTDGVKLER